MPESVLRTFIAVELDEALRIALAELQARFKRQAPPGSVKWVSPDGIHLTLKFLGDTPSRRLGEIRAALEAACADLRPFEVALAGRGCVPNTRRPRVVWVGVHDSGRRLARLQDAIERNVAPLGWPVEARPFSPHLTLGRLARDAGARVAAQVGTVIESSIVEHIGSQTVTGVLLVQSELRTSGALYRTLLCVPLGAAQRPQAERVAGERSD